MRRVAQHRLALLRLTQAYDCLRNVTSAMAEGYARMLMVQKQLNYRHVMHYFAAHTCWGNSTTQTSSRECIWESM